MVVTPDYYREFRCIADKCKHNCCIGWEIDIDPETYAVYEKTEGELGRRLRENIDHTERCFKLTPQQRCPFLNDGNLCDIIIEAGDNALCQICTDHPRFRSCVEDVEEIGIGLCCEAAVKLVLGKKDITKIPHSHCKNQEANMLFETRKEIISLLQNRRLPLTKRFEMIYSKFGVGLYNFDVQEIKKLLIKLERFDPEWEKYIKRMQFEAFNALDDSRWQTAFEQIAVYFVYRHFTGGYTDGKYIERLDFLAFAMFVIVSMFDGESMESLEETVRMFSVEIEYSLENFEEVLNYL